MCFFHYILKKLRKSIIVWWIFNNRYKNCKSKFCWCSCSYIFKESNNLLVYLFSTKYIWTIKLKNFCCLLSEENDTKKMSKTMSWCFTMISYAQNSFWKWQICKHSFANSWDNGFKCIFKTVIGHCSNEIFNILKVCYWHIK